MKASAKPPAKGQCVTQTWEKVKTPFTYSTSEKSLFTFPFFFFKALLLYVLYVAFFRHLISL